MRLSEHTVPQSTGALLFSQKTCNAIKLGKVSTIFGHKPRYTHTVFTGSFSHPWWFHPTETIFKVDVLNPISSCCFLNLLMVKSREMSSWFSLPATCKYNMFDVQHVQIAFIFPTPHAAMQTAANLKFKLLQFQTALVLPCHCSSLKWTQLTSGYPGRCTPHISNFLNPTQLRGIYSTGVVTNQEINRKLSSSNPHCGIYSSCFSNILHFSIHIIHIFWRSSDNLSDIYSVILGHICSDVLSEKVLWHFPVRSVWHLYRTFYISHFFLAFDQAFFQAGIWFGILSDSLSGTLSGILSGTLSDMYSDRLSDILSGMCSGLARPRGLGDHLRDFCRNHLRRV